MQHSRWHRVSGNRTGETDAVVSCVWLAFLLW